MANAHTLHASSNGESLRKYGIALPPYAFTALNHPIGLAPFQIWLSFACSQG